MVFEGSFEGSFDRIFEGRDVYTGQPTRVVVQNGRIAEVQRGIPLSQPDVFLGPGLVDLQVNGYQGRDYTSPHLTHKDITAITTALAQTGTLRHYPTIITSAQGTMLRNLALISQAVRGDVLLSQAISGIHLEGPYLSPVDGARGAHSLAHVRLPDLQELDAWQEAAQGLVVMITLAPELPGAIEFIRQATKLGIRVALGHTLANSQQIDQAIAAGAVLSTHLGNGSPALLPRLNNPIWSQLSRQELVASLIADGHHLPDEVLQVFCRAKGLNGLILVSDVGPMGGLAPGRYHWGDTLVEVEASGRLGVADTEYLAGAGFLLDRCIPRFIKATGHSLAEVYHLASGRPAQLMGIRHHTGFEVGELADLILFDWDGADLHTRASMLGTQAHTAI